MTPSPRPTRAAAAAALAAALAAGCGMLRDSRNPRPVVPTDLPRELEKVMLPDYRVEPPDILQIEAVRAVPRPPYKVQPQDVLFVQFPVADPAAPRVSGSVGVDTDGTIDLGAEYGGGFPVEGKTTAEIRDALAQHLTNIYQRKKDTAIQPADVTVTLSQSQAAQRITGPHLVRPDGTVALGTYGSVKVAGLTLPEVRRAVEAQLNSYLLDPVVAVDVLSYNSKLIYVIFDAAGNGQTVQRVPVTGNDTVLDVIAQSGGLTGVSDVNRLWIARPSPAGAAHQILPVDWRAITECGDPATNYQLMPGDRLFVGSNPSLAVDGRLARLFAPFERVAGAVLLGVSIPRAINRINGRGGSSSNNSGF